MQKMHWPVLPAQPGFEVLTMLGDVIEHLRVGVSEPVIGWRITPDGALPITIRNLDDTFATAIKYPDGRVVEVRGDGCSIYPNEGAWHRQMFRRHLGSSSAKIRFVE